MIQTLIIALICIFVFTLILVYLYRLADGKKKVKEKNKENYRVWTIEHGTHLKSAIILFSFVYVLAVIFILLFIVIE